jgi:hypothetical protein
MRRLRRGRATLTLATLATGLLVAGVLPSTGATASAAPPTCQDGSPPPCDLPDPDPDPDPDPGGGGGGGGTGWTSLVSVLDQSEDGYDDNIRGAWTTTGSPVYSTPSGTVQWDTADHDQGSISLTSTYLPSGPKRGFHLNEQDQSIDGSLCRSRPVTSISQVVHSTHVLVGEEATTTAADLAEMADGFVGTISIPESQSGTYSATIDLDAVTIEPKAGALALTVDGHLFVDGPGPLNVDGDFFYRGDVSLSPSRKAEVEQVVVAGVANAVLAIDDEDADTEAEALPVFNQAVREKVSGAVADRVAASPEVQWFATLGYTASFRDVSIDTGGIHVLPSLCKVG